MNFKTFFINYCFFAAIAIILIILIVGYVDANYAPLANGTNGRVNVTMSYDSPLNLNKCWYHGREYGCKRNLTQMLEEEQKDVTKR